MKDIQEIGKLFFDIFHYAPLIDTNLIESPLIFLSNYNKNLISD